MLEITGLRHAHGAHRVLEGIGLEGGGGELVTTAGPSGRVPGSAGRCAGRPRTSPKRRAGNMPHPPPDQKVRSSTAPRV